MAAQTEIKDLVPESERALAQEIARAMQPPLMSRLARVQSTYPELVEPVRAPGVPVSAAPPPPPPLPLRLDSPAAPASSPVIIDALADDPDMGWATPPSIEWLGKARRERNRARLQNVMAWVATLAIGGGIVAGTMLALQP